MGNGERGGRCLFRLEESLDLECGEMGCVKPPGGSENATISVVFLACRDGSCLREMCVEGIVDLEWCIFGDEGI